MAQRPDGKAAKTEAVSFTRPAAERIAKTVRLVEAGNRDAGGISYGSKDAGFFPAAKVFRIATFTGEWAKNTDKTVTFKYQTTTPNTVTASNLFAAVPESGDCAIAREGTAWFLIAAECSTSA